MTTFARLLCLLALPLGLLAAPKAAPLTQEVLFEPKGAFPAQGGPAVKVGFFGDRVGLLVGGTGSLILGEGLGLGMGGYSLSSELTTEFDGAVHDVGLSYGGLIIENSFFERKLFYFNVSTMIGPGQAYAVARRAGSRREQVLFFLVEPELSCMLNVTRELRVGLGIGYRVSAGSDVGRIVGMDMNGFSSKFTLYYGRL
jgi:hypothetical protein